MKNNLPKWEFILLLNVHGIITIVALLGSYFVLRAFHKFRKLRTASNNILVSLSIADGLLAIPLILDIIQLCLKCNVGHCPHMHILKGVDGTITLFLLSVIVLHLSLMSSKRFIAIKFALRYQAIVTKRRARIVSIAMWLWALVVNVAVPEVLQKTTGKDFRKFHRQMNTHECNTTHNTIQVHPIRWHLVFTAVSMFLVPLLIILCSYTYIFIVSYKQRQHVREQGRDIPGMPTIKHHMKGAHTLAIVAAVCLLSIIALLVVTSLRIVYGKSLGRRDQTLMENIVYDVAMFLNAVCNPLIYGWKNEEFRNAFRKMLKCC
ncbi:adrenocorticotropic hormone receptor-like [Porites lutea]|uniref:adrenocorticotropic hormone receptor-like n=1 Tax=Porites lutea TaxID=51062 RepID=UPI003CC68898